MTTKPVPYGNSDFDIGVDMSDMMMIIMMVVMVSVVSGLATTTAQATQTTQALQAQSYEGLTYSKVLHANSVLQWENLVSGPPYAPLVTVSFHNDGWLDSGVHYDWSVFIGINNPDELHELASGEDYEVDMSGGGRRIEFIYYKTEPGQRASVRVAGKY